MPARARPKIARPTATGIRGWIKTLLGRFPALERGVRRLYAGGSGPGDWSPDWLEPNRDPNLTKDLRGRFCEAPFRQLDLYETGKAHLCCSAWLPAPIGDLNRQSLDEVWNSSEARAIRASIFDGSFRFCNHTLCPKIQSLELQRLDHAERDPEVGRYVRERRVELDGPPTFVNLCNDPSCNLQCPSCRTGLINDTKGPEFDRRKRLQDKLTRALFSAPSTRPFTVNVTGSGDPFASRMFREFLFELDGGAFPNLKVNLQTNGVLLTPETWDRIRRIHNNLSEIIVSFDAATEPTYAITRRGGRWNLLLENTRFLAGRRRGGDFGVLRLDFVVQRDNFREMAEFVRLGKRLGVDQVGFSRIVDWGTWPAPVFREKCIWRDDHPEFDAFLEVLRDPVFDDPVVGLGNLTGYRKRALARSAIQ